MQTSSKLLGPGAAVPQIRFGGSDWHWKWLDRSVQSLSFPLYLPRLERKWWIWNGWKKKKTKGLPLYYITCGGYREPLPSVNELKHIPPIHKSKVMDGWESKRKFFPIVPFFLNFLSRFSRWPALCVARNRFVRDWWFQFFHTYKE